MPGHSFFQSLLSDLKKKKKKSRKNPKHIEFFMVG